MTIRVSADKLQGHVHLVSGADDGALDDGVDAELAGDVGQWASGRFLVLAMTDVRETSAKIGDAGGAQ